MLPITEEAYEDFILTRWEYAVGGDVEPRMTDPVYNSVYARYKELMPDNEYVKRVWSEDPCPIDLLKKHHLEHLYRDISISYGSESIASLRSMAEVEAKFRNLNKKTRVSLKVDGWNTQNNYYNCWINSGNTRGRVTNPLKANVLLEVVPKKITLPKRVKVIGEAIIPNSKWERYKAMTGNSGQRHSVSTIIANGDHGFVEVIAFNIMSNDVEVPADKYATLQEWGFKTPMFVWVHNYAELLSAIKMLGKFKDKVDYESDGLVVENEDIQIALRVGEWAEVDVLTYVTGYTESPTSYGISMTLNVYQVKAGDVKVSNPNITNINMIEKHMLEPNSPVAFVMRSGANPVINFVRTKELQEEYEGRYDEYCEMIRKSEAAK